jgi:hypothetical protein
MRVFVTGAGRCGTGTFSGALSAHVTNFTVAHESQCEKPPWTYPDNHIEVDPRLLWQLPSLLRTYPDAYWVILDRDRAAMARSLGSRQEIMDAWHRVAFGTLQSPDVEAFVEFVYSALEALLRDHDRVTRLVTPVDRETFEVFWSAIGAEGDLTGACLALKEVRNEGAVSCAWAGDLCT